MLLRIISSTPPSTSRARAADSTGNVIASTDPWVPCSLTFSGMQEDQAVCSDDVSAEQNPEAVRAPRHGLNAKALLLQAAAQAAQEAAEIEEHAPDTISAQDQEIAKLKAAFAASAKLLTGVPKRETPIVAFVNTTKASKDHHSCCRV